MNDGTYGALLVKACGGIVLVQDPAEALSPMMPTSVINHAAADHVLRVAELAKIIDHLSWKPLTSEVATTSRLATEVDPLPGEVKEFAVPEGTLVPLICPECGGPLWRQAQGDLVRYRCHTGHAMTAESLMESQFDEVESALWTAVRVLDEQGVLLQDMAHRARGRSLNYSADSFRERAAEVKQRAHIIRQLLLRPNG